MEKEVSHNKRGGRREGAGRPKTDSQLFAFRAGGELARYINSHENKTQFITGCIETAMHNDSTEAQGIGRLGEVYPASQLKPLHLPYFDVSVVAGFPIPLDNDELAQDIELLRMLCPNPESSYLIRVHGDSMADADIRTGDILIVDKSNREPSEKQVALCELNGEYTIKYVDRTDGHCRLVPANEHFPVIDVKPDDSFRVWGVVTYIIHKPRR